MVLPASGILSVQNIESEWLIGTAITKKLNGDLGPLIAISASATTNLGGSFYGKAYARAVTGITQGTTTSSSITLNWSGGGAGATSFSITSSPATTTQTASASGYNFTGLAASTAYTFTIVSKNAQGVAGQSATSGSFSTSASGSLYTMTFPFTFTNMGATGANGPSAITYSPIPGNGTAYVLTLTGGIQYWTVPTTRSYSFSIAGAGSSAPLSSNAVKTGYGFVQTATYSLTAGTKIAILVGQQGASFTGSTSTAGNGGTFVARYVGTTYTLLFASGGAGGPGYQITTGSNGALNGNSGTSGRAGTTLGTAGTGGNGGGGPTSTGSHGAAGGGYLTSGTKGTSLSTPGFGFLQGGAGGAGASNGGPGGFGGGGGAGNNNGGGGGGYSGGAGGARSSSGAGGGGGGTYSINGAASGTATNSGMGYVTVT